MDWLGALSWPGPIAWPNDSESIFYVFASLAVLIGGGVAFWRFVVQQPYGVAWKVEPAPTCHVRVGRGGLYLFVLHIDIYNLSVSRQECTKVWTRIVTPDDDEFNHTYSPNVTVEEVTKRLGKGHEWRWVVPAGGRLRISVPSESYDLFQVVAYELVIQSEPRGLLRLLPFLGPEMYVGLAKVPVDAEDIRLYQADKAVGAAGALLVAGLLVAGVAAVARRYRVGRASGR